MLTKSSDMNCQERRGKENEQFYHKCHCTLREKGMKKQSNLCYVAAANMGFQGWQWNLARGSEIAQQST